MEGERTCYINDTKSNQQFKFCSNYVSTTKYNLVTFLPKFLFGACLTSLVSGVGRWKLRTEQFSKYANLFFLFTVCIQQIPGVSPTNQYTTILPLSFVLLVAAVKESQEDLVRATLALIGAAACSHDAQKRRQSDRDLNSRAAKVLVGEEFVNKPWRKLRPGDIVRLDNNDFFPADLILLASSEPDGLCYIETSNLDGCVFFRPAESRCVDQ